MALVVARRCRRFVVHNHLNAFSGSVSMNAFDVKIRIRRHEIENGVFFVAKPVFPTFVPALYEDGVEAVFGCEINVALHVGCVCTVSSVGFCFRIIGFAESYGQ